MVVVFDRIREYIGEHTKWKFTDTVNAALNSTLPNLNTSLTTLIVLLAIFIFGGESIEALFALIVGVSLGPILRFYCNR